MKALSLDPPWAQAIAAGVKVAETRDRPPAGEMCPPGQRPQPGRAIRRGERIAIHSTAKLSHVGRIGTRNEIGTWEVERDRAGLLARGEGLAWPWRLSTGVFVATAVVVDAAPMLERGESPPLGWSAIYDEPHEGDLPHQQGGLWVIGVGPVNGGMPTRIEHHRPWGFYAPGRWAWFLADIRRASDVVACPGCIDPHPNGMPRHMHQGVWTVPESVVPRLTQEMRP